MAIYNREGAMLVYICAPYSGDIEQNIARATKYAKRIYKHGMIPITPHLL